MHQQTLCEAVKARKNVYLRYDDDRLEREFSPYIVYYTSKDILSVAGYQVKNPAEPLERDVWRNLHLSTIRTARVSEDGFTVDQTFNPADKRYGTRIICHVKQYVT